MSRRYTREQHAFLQEVLKDHVSWEAAELFNERFHPDPPVTPKAACNYRKNHGVRLELTRSELMKRARKRKYTQEQLDWIQKTYMDHSVRELTELFNKRYGASLTITTMKGILGNHKISTNGRRDGRFKKGSVSFNKGKRQEDFMSPEAIERTKATRFRKGQVSPNTMELGAERDVGGYIYVKVSMDKGLKVWERWRPKSVLEWEKHHGRRVPDGSIVIFLDGDRRNFDIDNLKLVSRGASVKANQRHMKESPEIYEAALNLYELEIALEKAEKGSRKKRRRNGSRINQREEY